MIIVNQSRIGYWAENRMFLYADGNMWETMWNQKSEGASLCTGTEGTASEHEVEYVFTHANAGLVVFFGTSAEKEIKTVYSIVILLIVSLWY